MLSHMTVVQFHSTDFEDVLRLREATFEAMDDISFAWHPCQQVESLERKCAKYVFKDEGVKGYVAAYRIDETHFRLNLIVDPHHAGRGLGTLLLGRIETEVRTSGGKYLQARLRAGMETSLLFALARGFREVHRMRGMILLATDFDYPRWEGLAKKLSAIGYSLTTLKEELECGNNPLDMLAALQWRAREGWPSPDPT